MNTRTVVLLLVALALMVTAATAESDLYRRFKDCYGQMGSDLAMKPPAELARISNFVYTKDVATFTFEDGQLYLLRELEGRPTTAIFLGKGSAHIDVPSHVERNSLNYASGKDDVNETFEVAFIDFSDDFDLRLKEKFQFEKTVLNWGDFNRAQQGEFFFKPSILHEYDNYFQLLRSLYERRGDGYFWIDFNRYVYSFDPNRPEEVVVAYEHEGGDIVPTDGAVMQRKEKAVYDDYRMSDIAYPTTMLSREGEMKMVGLDGKNIERADITVKMLINVDSLRFVSLFLHHNLKIDSAFYKGAPLEYWRRGSFKFMGLILPEYVYRGDTVEVRLVYHGTKYEQPLPFVENPAPTPHLLKFSVHTGYNYVMPGMAPAESSEKGWTRFEAAPAEPYRMFLFQPYATGFDTTTVISDIGLSLNFLVSGAIDKNHYDSYIPAEVFQPKVTQAFNFLSTRLGPPPGAFAQYIYPEPTSTIPGLFGVSQTTDHPDGTGGLIMEAAASAARQYFGPLMRPRSDREIWLTEAVPEYLSLLAVWHEIDPGVFFGELRLRRNYLYSLLELDNDRPLGTGRRVGPELARTKGAWVLHMLRFMMYDLKGQGNRDQTFWRYINDLKNQVNFATFTNEDVIRLTEKYYGDSLGWFFNSWLYSRNIPEYNVQYAVEKRGDGNYVVGDVSMSKMEPDFRMPVIIRVQSEGGESAYERVMIEGEHDTFELGPYVFTPKEITFNEFHSVLSKDNVKKK